MSSGALHIPPLFWPHPRGGCDQQAPYLSPPPSPGSWESNKAPAGRGGKAAPSAISSWQWEGLETALQLPRGA